MTTTPQSPDRIGATPAVPAGTEQPSAARSWLRPKTIVISLILATVAGVGIWAYSILTLTPGKPGQFTAAMNQLVADAQADTLGKPNSWDTFIAACDLYQRSAKAFIESPKMKALSEGGWPKELGWPPTPEMIADPNATGSVRVQLLDFIKQLDDAGVNAKLDEVAAGVRFIRELPADTKTTEMMFTEIGSARSLARLCRARMFLALEAGNAREFIRAARHALVLGDFMKKQFTTMDSLVGVAIDAWVSSAIREAIVRGQLSPETCRELLAMYQGRASTFDVDLLFQSELLSAKDLVEWTHSDDGNGDGRLVASEMLYAVNPKLIPRSLVNFGSVLASSKAQTLATFEDLFAKSRAYAALPLRKRLAVESPRDAFERLPKRQVVVRTHFPYLEGDILHAERADLTTAGTKIMLALEIHRAAKGSYPPSLIQLEPSLQALGVKELWITELRYKVFAPGADPDGRGYVLYWIGIDNVDNDGRFNERLNQETWLKHSAGFDQIINVPVSKPNTPSNPADPIQEAPK
jgi:hypothetical protein